jgi:L-cysteine/cystine lyase
MSLDPWALRRGMGLPQRYLYLNTGFIGPVTQAALEAEREHLQWETEAGLTTTRAFEGTRERMAGVRATVARAINADADEIALMGCTSDGIRAVLLGLDWRPGDEVVTTSLEHHAGYLPAMWLEAERGCVMRMARIPEAATPEQALEAVIREFTERTRLVILSVVAYSGLHLPIESITRAAHERGIFVLADGAQVLGHVPVDVRTWGVDALALPGQKWALSQQGTGALFVRRDRLPEISSIPVTGSAVVAHGPDVPYQPITDIALKFETSTRSAAAFMGFRASLNLLDGLGWESVFGAIRDASRVVRNGLRSIPGVTLLSPDDDSATGLVTFRLEGIDPAPAVQALLERHRIVCRKIPATNGIRLTLAPFLLPDELERAVEAVAELGRDRS